MTLNNPHNDIITPLNIKKGLSMFSKLLMVLFQRDDVKIKLIDLFIILIMMTLAACGLIYEYVFLIILDEFR